MAPKKPAPKKFRRYVSLHRLLNLFSDDLIDVARELEKLQPSRKTLVSLWKTLVQLGVPERHRNVVVAYCKTRGFDPAAPPNFRHPPQSGETRTYRVQRSKETNRPFVWLPLDNLGNVDHVSVYFVPGGRKIEVDRYEP